MNTANTLYVSSKNKCEGKMAARAEKRLKHKRTIDYYENKGSHVTTLRNAVKISFPLLRPRLSLLIIDGAINRTQ